LRQFCTPGFFNECNTGQQRVNNLIGEKDLGILQGLFHFFVSNRFFFGIRAIAGLERDFDLFMAGTPATGHSPTTRRTPMWLNKLWQRWMGPTTRQVRRRCRQPRTGKHFTLELLEDRTLLTAPPITVSTTSDLIAAINTANSSGGGTITLAGQTTFDFTTANNSTDGRNALPVITANVILIGNGDTIERDSKSTTAFRLFDVAGGGSLILEALTLQGGLVQGVGVSAEGGAIYNSGALALSGVTVQGNEADGLPGVSGSNQAGGNGADAFGGGLYVAGGNVSLTDATNFNHNFVHAGNGGAGGNSGVHASGAGLRGGDGGKGLGGGIYVAAGSVGLNTNTIVQDNNALGGNGGIGGAGSNGRNGGAGGIGGDGLGGGLYVAGGSVILNNVEIALNQAKGGFGGNGGNGAVGSGSGGLGGNGAGGGLYAAGASVSLNNVEIDDNFATGSDGGAGGKPGGSHSPGFGGGGGSGYGGGAVISTTGSVTLSNNKLLNNRATGGNGGHGGAGNGGGSGVGGSGSGGGLYAAGSSVTLSSDTINNNQAQGGFGGNNNNTSHIGFVGGTLGSGGGGLGGGLFVAAKSSVTLSGATTLSGNSAKGGNGGSSNLATKIGSFKNSGGAGGDGSGGGLYVLALSDSLSVTLSSDNLNGNLAAGGNGGRAGNGGNGYGGRGGSGYGGGFYATGVNNIILSNDTLNHNTAQGGLGGHGGRVGGSGESGLGGIGGIGVGGGLYVNSSKLSNVSLSNDTFSTNAAYGGVGGTGGNTGGIGGEKYNGAQGGLGGIGLGGGLYVEAPSGPSFNVNLSNDSLNNNTARGGAGGTGGPDLAHDGGPGGAGGGAGGGGLYVTAASSIVTLSNDNVFKNVAQGGYGGHGGNDQGNQSNLNQNNYGGGDGSDGGYATGGGVELAEVSSATLNNDILSGNTASGGHGGNGGSGGSSTKHKGGPGGYGGIGGDAKGGGLFVSFGSIVLTNSTLNNNTAQGGTGGQGGKGGPGGHPNSGLFASSGGIGNSGGSGGAGMGGGLYVSAVSTTLTNDTLSGNVASGGNGGQGGAGNIGKIFGGAGGAGGRGGDAGGGGLDVAAGSVSLINDTLAGNSVRGASGGNGGQGGGFNKLGSGSSVGGIGGIGGAGGNGAGGGLYIVSPSTVNLANTLIANDTVAVGAGGTGGAGGHGNTDGTNGATGSGGSASGYDVYGSVSSSDHDLIGNSIGSSGFSSAHGDILDPLSAGMGPLANNGGATAGAPGSQQVVQTMALLPVSPAINAGDNSASGLPATDQRGNPRIAVNAVDIGAFEVQPPPGGGGGGGGGGSGGGGGGGSSPSPPAPPSLHTPPLLGFFDALLHGIETVNANGTETVVDRFFGIPLFISTYDSAGHLMSVTLFGFNVTILFELL
jgi:hypothetical protein